MIVFDLACGACGTTFEGWFSSGQDFDRQQSAGLIDCPACSSSAIAKAPMAPSVARKGADTLAAISHLQQRMLEGSEWVGDRFAETARAMHVGDIAHAKVHGQATADQALSLIEDGITVVPLPLPVRPPDQVN
jgi:hypothetical protein